MDGKTKDALRARGMMTRAISGAMLGITVLASFLGYMCIANAQRTCSFADPFLLTTGLCCLVGIVAVVGNRLEAKLLQNACVLPSVVLLLLTVANWPGGDDGPGMILIGGVGPLLIFALLLSVVSTALVFKNV